MSDRVPMTGLGLVRADTNLDLYVDISKHMYGMSWSSPDNRVGDR